MSYDGLGIDLNTNMSAFMQTKALEEERQRTEDVGLIKILGTPKPIKKKWDDNKWDIQPILVQKGRRDSPSNEKVKVKIGSPFKW